MTNDAILELLKGRIDRAQRSVGMVVGVVDKHGSRTISHGTGCVGGRKVDSDTVFEIGSITKVFTTLLLAEMAEHGEVNLDCPIAKYLPGSVNVPARKRRNITLRHLATHLSGLPREPENYPNADEYNPYAGYTVHRLYDFLSSYALPRGIGEKCEYSNLGVGLLGHILARRAGTDYETLVRTRICQPLGMSSTGITVTPTLARRLAAGHTYLRKPVPAFESPALEGCGALRSTVNDLLIFLAANMGLNQTPLTAVMQRTHLPQHAGAKPEEKVALGWWILKRYSSDIIWHNGSTIGQHSFIGFNKKKRLGVVVLSNMKYPVEDIGFHILEAKHKLSKTVPPERYKTVRIVPRIFDDYVGQYQLDPEHVVCVSREGERIFCQVPGRAKREMYAINQHEFFFATIEAMVSFARNAAGKVTHRIVNVDGHETRQPRLA